jgi:hypothetical protein
MRTAVEHEEQQAGQAIFRRGDAGQRGRGGAVPGVCCSASHDIAGQWVGLGYRPAKTA